MNYFRTTSILRMGHYSLLAISIFLMTTLVFCIIFFLDFKNWKAILSLLTHSLHASLSIAISLLNIEWTCNRFWCFYYILQDLKKWRNIILCWRIARMLCLLRLKLWSCRWDHYFLIICYILCIWLILVFSFSWHVKGTQMNHNIYVNEPNESHYYLSSFCFPLTYI